MRRSQLRQEYTAGGNNRKNPNPGSFRQPAPFQSVYTGNDKAEERPGNGRDRRLDGIQDPGLGGDPRNKGRHENTGEVYDVIIVLGEAALG